METEKDGALPEHYERAIGTIARGWSDQTSELSISIVRFADAPEDGVATFATLGLSKFILELATGRTIRQELLVSANNTFSEAAVAGFLLSLAEDLAERGRALLRGEVIGPGRPVISGATTTAVYVANPTPFDKSLTEFVSVPPPTVFAYLIPITSSEAHLIRDRGWRWFEDQLEAQDPDIWNLARSEEVL